MKKFITYAVTVASVVYYACMPFAVVRADVASFGASSTGDITTGTSAGTTLAVLPLVPTATPTTTIASVLSMRVTAYASVPDETDDTPFITADGTHVYDGEIASNIFPFGTRVEIPALFGDKVFVVHDRMSLKIKNTIDIWMPSVGKALYFGAQHADILVLAAPVSSTLSLAAAR